MTPTDQRVYDVLIIGSGFSGLGMGVALKQEKKRSFLIFEKDTEVGGTWRDNQYPGCACDIPSHLYSYSFAPNPTWSRLFAPQKEIFDYLKNCADTYGLRPHIRFGSEIAKAVYDEAQRLWVVHVKGGHRYLGRVLVSGQGALHHPSTPDIPGLDSFSGDVLHSAAWQPDIDLKGKRVAVVGTGASAIQIVPAIAQEVDHLHVFQRTASWILPKPDAPISAGRQRRMARWPLLQKLARGFIYGYLERRMPSLLKDSSRRGQEAIALKHLHDQVSDPGLRARLTPDYQMGCKRTLLSNDFYPTLCRDNVSLETGGIDKITPDGIVTQSGETVGLDAIIFATGFAVTDTSKNPLEIIGRDGRNLKQENAVTQSAYLGIAAEGYPNYFLLMGPHTGLGHNSMIYMIESQIAFIMQMLSAMDARGAAAVEVTKMAQDAFEAEMDRKMQGTVWSSGCTSWYLDNQGRNTAIWPDYTFRYRNRTRKIKPNDFVFYGAPATDTLAGAA